MMLRKKHALHENIDVLLLALIICMNINRFYVAGASNRITYPIYLLFIVITFFSNRELNGKFFKVRCSNPAVLILSITICFSSFFGSILLGKESMQMTIKLIVSLIIAYGSSLFTTDKIKRTIVYLVVYNFIYSIILLLEPDKAVSIMRSGTMTYLNITMTLGLVLTICLCQVLMIMYGLKKDKKTLFTYVFLAVFMLFVMSGFNSRGTIIIPIIAFIVVLLLVAPQKPIKIFGVIVAATVLLTIGYNIYIENASSYALNRMLRLFNDTYSEMRLGLWERYIKEIIEHHWYIFGGGANVSRISLGYYPHNLYLQLIGEYGIIGLLFGVVGTVFIISRIIIFWKIVRRNCDVDAFDNISVAFVCISCLVYYFLTFMKSFSFFDAYPLFIFYAFTNRCVTEMCSFYSDELIENPTN